VYAVLGEDDSDVDTLKVLIRRLAMEPNLPIKKKGYGSCGEMLNKGAKHLKLFKEEGCTRLIVCYDSDGQDKQERFNEALEKVIRPAGIPPYITGMSLCGMEACCCIVIPVQEIESWILADIQSVSKVFSGWRPAPIRQNPETIESPKEFLEKLSRQGVRPRYSHAAHNKVVAEHINLGLVRNRCESFGALVDFVLN